MKDFEKKLLKAIKSGQAKMMSMPMPESLMELLEDDDEDRIDIGKVSPELLKRYRQMNREWEMLHKEVELFAKQLELEAQKKVDDLFHERLEAMNDSKSEIWNEISDVMGVPREKNLSIDIRNGTISADKDEPEVLFDEDKLNLN